MDDWRKRHNVALDEQRAAYLDVDEADKLWPHAREEFYAAVAQANSRLSNAKRNMLIRLTHTNAEAY